MSGDGSGLMGSIRRLTTTLTSVVSTRLELLANEVQEERLRLAQMFLLYLLTLFFFGLSILLLTAFVVVLFWDEHRLVTLGGLFFLFLALGTLMALLLRNLLQSKSKLFTASLAELAKDREQLGANDE